MAMSKHYYELVAHVLNDTLREARFDAQKKVLQRLCHRFADVFHGQSDNFSGATFLNVCFQGVDQLVEDEAPRVRINPPPHGMNSPFARWVTRQQVVDEGYPAPPVQAPAPVRANRPVTATEQRLVGDVSQHIQEIARYMEGNWHHQPVAAAPPNGDFNSRYLRSPAEMRDLQRRAMETLLSFDQPAAEEQPPAQQASPERPPRQG